MYNRFRRTYWLNKYVKEESKFSPINEKGVFMTIAIQSPKVSLTLKSQGITVQVAQFTLAIEILRPSIRLAF